MADGDILFHRNHSDRDLNKKGNKFNNVGGQIKQNRCERLESIGMSHMSAMDQNEFRHGCERDTYRAFRI